MSSELFDLRKMQRNKAQLPMYFSDSDDDDSDPRPAARRGLVIEELQYKMDLAKSVEESLKNLAENRRHLGTNNMRNNLLIKRLSDKKSVSKSVQTDPDASGLDPSWLKSVQELADQLHAGLGNLINSGYHHSRASRYLKQENGFWRSTLMPNVRIAIPRDFKESKQVLPEEFKQSLNRLMEKARKLQAIIPDLQDAIKLNEMSDHSEKTNDFKNVNKYVFEDEVASTSASCSQVHGTSSSTDDKKAAVFKTKIPKYVLADSSNKHLKRELEAGAPVSIDGKRKKLNPVDQRKGENRPPKVENFIRRNILAIRAPVINPSKSTAKIRYR